MLFMSFLAKSGNPEKKYKYRKFLKLKARFISLYAGFLLPQEMTSVSTQQCLLAMTTRYPHRQCLGYVTTSLKNKNTHKPKLMGITKDIIIFIIAY